jgi:hypothetical protein
MESRLIDEKPFGLDVFVFLAFNAISMILLSQKLLHSKIFTLHKIITMIIMINIMTLHIAMSSLITKLRSHFRRKNITIMKWNTAILSAWICKNTYTELLTQIRRII